jgi:hypothetical protein
MLPGRDHRTGAKENTMSEEESTSVLGGLADAASSAVNAVGDYAASTADAAWGVAQVVGSGEASIVAGGAYAVGAYETASEFNSDATQLSQGADESFATSNAELAQAVDDVVGS